MNILPHPSITVGAGSIGGLAKVLSNLAVRRLLVVTDRGIIMAGIYEKVKTIIETTGTEILLVSDVQPDPSLKLVQKIAGVARAAGADAVLGLGGGSSIDSAKVAAALCTNPGQINDYIGTDLLEKPSLPIIAVPTTAGTGSEVTHIAILSDEEEEVKKGLVSVRIMPAFAFLDPELTVGLPPLITASTGMDALCHAVEAYTSVHAGEYSDALALRAMELLSRNIETAFNDGSDLRARENMLTGSLFAGMAFANAGVTAVHAFAYPLGGMFHVPHGLANSLMLPTVLKFNTRGSEERFIRIGKAIAPVPAGGRGCEPDAETAVKRVEELSRNLKLPRNLAAAGIPREAIGTMAKAVVQITRLLSNNPRQIGLDDAVAIYTEAFDR